MDRTPLPSGILGATDTLDGPRTRHLQYLMAAASLPPPPRYDAGENWTRRKHAGISNYPVFAGKGKVKIGKCPKGFTQASAQAWLNAPDTLRLRKASSPPSEAVWLFAIVEGVLHGAVRSVGRGTNDASGQLASTTGGKVASELQWMRLEIECQMR